MKTVILAVILSTVVGCTQGPQAEMEPETPAKGQAMKQLGVEKSNKIDSVAPDK